MTAICLVEIRTDDDHCWAQMISENVRPEVYLPAAGQTHCQYRLSWSSSTGLGWGNLQLIAPDGHIRGSWWIGPDWRTVKIKSLKVTIRAICPTSQNDRRSSLDL